MKAAFISDIHIGSSDEPKYQSLLTFLKSLSQQNLDHLILLGDIFDLWVGDYAYFRKKHKSLIDALVELKNTGVVIHYFEGNHDLYLKDFFGKDLGFEIHPNDYTVSWDGVKIRMEHGDLANPDDTGYLMLRGFLRNPLIRFALTHLSGGVIQKIGDKASQASRKYTDQIDVDAKEVIRTYANHLSKTQDFDVLITGHTHQKDDYEFEAVSGKKIRSINLGSWFSKEIQYLMFEDGKFEFKNIN